MKSSFLVSLLPGLAAAAAPSVASLGSSYSFGAGLSKSYGKLLSELLEKQAGQAAIYDNLASSGKNVTDVAANQASKLAGHPYTAVVLTAGGNDLNYVGCLNNPSAGYCTRTIDENIFKTRFGGALDAIVKHLTDPKEVPIYVVTYTQGIGKDTKCSSDNAQCKLTSEHVKVVTDIYNHVVDWTVASVDSWKKTGSNSEYKVKIVPMRSYSSDRHDVGSSSPWINGAVGRDKEGDGSGWHPNEAGAHFIAEAIFNDLNHQDPPPH